MFTGLVSDVGKVVSINTGEIHRIKIASSYPAADLALGASVAHDGVCLTLVEINPAEDGSEYVVEVSPETLSRTTLALWTEGASVNLERALKAGDELGGHIVQGHVDGVGTVQNIRDKEGWLHIQVEAPEVLARFIAEKGSIAVNGISLTVNGVEKNCFDLMIIPHTASVTTIGKIQPGDRVNLEVDIMARYAARLAEFGETTDD